MSPKRCTFADENGTEFPAEFVCVCTCGREIHAAYLPGQPGAAPVGVVHEAPICGAFDALEPDEFLTWLRKRYEKGGTGPS